MDIWLLSENMLSHTACASSLHLARNAKKALLPGHQYMGTVSKSTGPIICMAALVMVFFTCAEILIERFIYWTLTTPLMVALSGSIAEQVTM